MIYILQFAECLSPAHTTQFYIGYARNRQQVDLRLAEHRAGRGARLTQVARERHIAFRLVCLLEGDRAEERRLKRQKHTRRIVERARRGTLRSQVVWTE